MSFDLFVYVSRDVDAEALRAALGKLQVPGTVAGDPRQFSGYVPVESNLPGMEGELLGGFEGAFRSDAGSEEAPSELRGRPVKGLFTLSIHADAPPRAT